MIKTIVITDSDTVVLHADLASGGAEEVNEVADRAGAPLDARGYPRGSSPWDCGKARRRAEEDAAIDAEDALAQADEANALSPVG